MKSVFIITILSLSVLSCSKKETTEPNLANGTIIGKVLYQENGQAVKNAQIYTQPATQNTLTDSAGYFKISDLKPGMYSVFAQKECCQTGSVSITVHSDSTSFCEIQLNKAEYIQTWTIAAGYSTTYNPFGVWSYGRKWEPDGKTFDLLTVRWGDSGWYMGNVGHGAPSFQSGPILWAKNNTNGLPALRWTNPQTGYFRLDITFVGIDSRGVDVTTYITINDSIVFSGIINSYQGTTHFVLPCIQLLKDDYIDFIIKWNGNIYYEYSWTLVKGFIYQY